MHRPIGRRGVIERGSANRFADRGPEPRRSSAVEPAGSRRLVDCRHVSDAEALAWANLIRRSPTCRCSERNRRACVRYCIGGTISRAHAATEFFNATSATTRATQSLQRFARQSQYLLVPKQVITSPESGLHYRIERLLGQGGFGQVFLAARAGPLADRVPDGRLHQGQQPHRRLAARSVLRRSARRPSSRDSRLRCLSAVRQRPGALLPGDGIRRARRSQRASRAIGEGLLRAGGAPRDRRHPAGARQAAPRPAAASRPDAASTCSCAIAGA